jgi:hypothetical protein
MAGQASATARSSRIGNRKIPSTKACRVTPRTRMAKLSAGMVEEASQFLCQAPSRWGDTRHLRRSAMPPQRWLLSRFPSGHHRTGRGRAKSLLRFWLLPRHAQGSERGAAPKSVHRSSQRASRRRRQRQRRISCVPPQSQLRRLTYGRPSANYSARGTRMEQYSRRRS